MDRFRERGRMENALRHQHPATRLCARFGLLDGLSLNVFDLRAGEERANVNLRFFRSGDVAGFGCLRRTAPHLASSQWRGREKKSTNQHTHRVTVAHWFSGYEKGLSDLKNQNPRDFHQAARAVAVFMLNTLRSSCL
jgi:hypothetical protein